MNYNKVNEIRKTIKELQARNISVLDINIIYEIDCQLDKKITDDEYIKLCNNVEYAYLKLDDVSLETIVYCGIKNLDKLDKDDFDFREECCYCLC